MLSSHNMGNHNGCSKYSHDRETNGLFLPGMDMCGIRRARGYFTFVTHNPLYFSGGLRLLEKFEAIPLMAIKSQSVWPISSGLATKRGD